jgi:2-methylcitrate dehydratase PrpD
MSSLEQLGAFVAGYKPDEAAQAAVRAHTADTVGAWIAATATAEGRALLALGAADPGLPACVTVNSALARLSEVDDIHLGSMITPGAIVVPTALTVAAWLPDRTPDDMIAAVATGYEVMIRLGAAIDGPSVLYRGIWPSYFAAPFGAAAVTSRLLRLSAEQAANALSIALIMAAPGTGHHAAITTARWLAVGLAVARGVQAAQAAARGFTSDVNIADGDFLKNIYGLTPDVTVLGRGLGELALHRVSHKPWCAARQTMAATQALREVLADGVEGASIARVGVAVLPPHLKMIDHGVTTGDRFSHLTSVSYQMALAAMEPEASFGLTPVPLSPEVAAFMTRIKVRGEESLLGAGYPRAWAAHITVATDQRRIERTVTHVPGDPERRFSVDELRQKFIRVTAGVLPRDQASAAFTMALTAIDRPSDMLSLIDGIVAIKS